MMILLLTSKTIHLDIYAAGKRKFQDADKNPLCLKRSHVHDNKQEKLDFRLFDAARTGNADAVEELLDMNANPNILINGCTALHIAARSHHFYCIRAFLASGKVAVNARADHFMTPLHEAVCVSKEEHKLLEVVCLTELIDRGGANINAQNSDKNTPLHLAAIYGHQHYVAILLARNANHMLQNAVGKTPLMIAEEKGFSAIIGLLNKKDNAEDMDIS